eukprot:Plantae.Rhodophyta-Hildenbrandia_rubra.ctg1422.p1 GENE.Plantae.Rhodophyta-Hildenbrandia_rubra.ctg1422~~Plantae.Rhodophyta-Hildenbrandia_rubra.ctg1422.p1  ORF type:complete len:558 (+),score=73.18 Plantae.Rhodophyta-Hildenbrandia_rubra.ctg1422:814-2487(+)
MHAWRWRRYHYHKRRSIFSFIIVNLILTTTLHRSLSSAQDTTPRWHLYRIVQREPISPTSFSSQSPKFDLRQVRTKVTPRIYIVDSGVKITHEEFEGRASHGRNIIDNSDDAGDCQGHGTHVAALAAGKTSGVAKQAEIVSVKILDCLGVGFCSDVTSAMMWVLAHHEETKSPASIVVMSVGSRDTKCESTARAADEMAAAGIVITAAAGNSGADACALFPAKNRATIAVGATDIDDELYTKSNFGDCVEIHGPGVRVLSAWGAGGDTTTLRSTGTSMSAPQVAAVAALIKGANPSLNVAEVKQILLDSSTKDAIHNPDGNELMQTSANRLLHAPWSRLFVDIEVDSDQEDAEKRLRKVLRLSSSKKEVTDIAALAVELVLTPSTYPAMKHSADNIATALASITSSVYLDNITAMLKPGSELRGDGSEPSIASLRYYIRVPKDNLTSMIDVYAKQAQGSRLQTISGESISLGPNPVMDAQSIIRDQGTDEGNGKSKIPFILGIVAGSVGGILLIAFLGWYSIRPRVRSRREERRLQEAIAENADNPVQFPEYMEARE